MIRASQVRKQIRMASLCLSDGNFLVVARDVARRKQSVHHKLLDNCLAIRSGSLRLWRRRNAARIVISSSTGDIGS